MIKNRTGLRNWTIISIDKTNTTRSSFKYITPDVIFRFNFASKLFDCNFHDHENEENFYDYSCSKS